MAGRAAGSPGCGGSTTTEKCPHHREQLVAALGAYASDPGSPPVVLVTILVEEIPPGFTHLLLLAEGRVVEKGPLTEVLTAEALSKAFGMPLALGYSNSRWHAVRR